MGKRLVHIVDDEDGIRRSASFMLKTSGFAVQSWPSGVAFLKEVRHVPNGCILLDVRMPEMDGLQVQEALIERGVAMPVIMLTGHADVSIAVRAMKAGAIDYIEKPFEKAVILAAIENAFAWLDDKDARQAEKLKDDLLRDKSIMLQELQHRVANSLQIIASVLLQSARRVQSDETRGHLHDAHSRIMSVAAIQQQLARGSVGDIALGPYFTDLCRSIGASMISDPEQLSLKVNADGTIVASEIASSLGLIVTELVINAFKHAFPDQRHGDIKVDYHSDGAAWALSVSDDGVGMPPASADPHIGLGTTIVQALAKKLDASVEISDAKPGTKVSIVSD